MSAPDRFRLHRVRAAGVGSGAARAPGSAGRAQAGGAAVLAGRRRRWPGAGRGSDTPRSAPGVFGFGPAAFPCWGGGAPLTRLPAAPLAGFSRGPAARGVRRRRFRERDPWLRSIASGAYHVIVAPPVVRVAAEHGLADWRGGPGAWRASRRRSASGAGADPGSGPAPRADPVARVVPAHDAGLADLPRQPAKVRHAVLDGAVGEALAAPLVVSRFSRIEGRRFFSH